ncbi:hypothetical protein DJ018_11200 [Phenylobacterium deserti]|uniref:Uncharacterized protein n=1 Tax=Phenylobacterium deserti TaxID=1914756 RepID=A0A328AE34_9CAUL|nr:hypothetical protein DJ018_11200 [Phenylobacterium deserti]
MVTHYVLIAALLALCGVSFGESEQLGLRLAVLHLSEPQPSRRSRSVAQSPETSMAWRSRCCLFASGFRLS